MGAVEHQHVRACVDKRAAAVDNVVRNADGRRAEQAACAVLGRMGIFEDLLYILYGYEAFKPVIIIHYGELFDAVLLKYLLCLVERGADKPGYEAVPGHYLADLPAHVGLKLHVAVGDDTDKLSVTVHYRDAGNTELCHKRVRIAERIVRAKRERVRDNAVFRALDHVDLLGLSVNAHVLVNDAYAALARYCDRHAVLCDRVHRSAHHRHVQPYLLCEPCGKVHIRRQHVALRRNEQHVVKRQPLADKTL